jgi:hypothetical protein
MRVSNVRIEKPRPRAGLFVSEIHSSGKGTIFMNNVQSPTCGHKACADIHLHVITIGNRKVNLIYERCDERSMRIEALVNDWKLDDKLATVVIEVPDQTWFMNTIHTAIDQDLKAGLAKGEHDILLRPNVRLGAATHI